MPLLDPTDLSAPLGGSQPLRGYLVQPSGEGPWPGVVVVHEIFGVDDVTRGLTSAESATRAAEGAGNGPF